MDTTARSIASITIIGLGNTMAGDDGVGPRVLELLAAGDADRLARLELVSAPGPEMVELLDAPGEVWFVDAARANDHKAGELIERIIAPGHDAALAPSQHLVSTHGLSLAELLRLADALGRRKASVRLFGVIGERFDPGVGLSPAVEASASALARRLMDELRRGAL